MLPTEYYSNFQSKGVIALPCSYPLRFLKPGGQVIILPVNLELTKISPIFLSTLSFGFTVSAIVRCIRGPHKYLTAPRLFGGVGVSPPCPPPPRRNVRQ